MKLNQILEIVIKDDSALAGFTPSTLPVAAKARIQNTLVSLESKLTHEELAALEQWTGGLEVFNKCEASFQDKNGSCCYYLYPDGSLYFSSTGDSEVWADAADFATERIIAGYDGKLDDRDAKLLTHLGGWFEDVVAERGVRA